MNRPGYLKLKYLFLSILFYINPLFTQQSSYIQDQDSTSLDNESQLDFHSDSLANDNQAFYDSLQQKASDNKFYQLLYETLVVERRSGVDKQGQFTRSIERFVSYNGRTINSIRYTKMSLLSAGLEDTSTTKGSWLNKALEIVHTTTKDHVIEKNVLFSPGDTVKSFTMADNERYLRSLPYIEDARILVEELEDSNRVNIIVVTKDKFSIGATVNVRSADAFSARLYDRNFLGLGTELSGTYMYDTSKDPKSGFDAEIIYDNIGGSFIRSKLGYTNTADEETGYLQFNKEFITPETKYGGGLDLIQSSTYRLIELDSLVQKQNYAYNRQDFWIGRQFLISSNTYRRNLIFSGRVDRREYTARPYTDADSNFVFHNAFLFLGNITYLKIRYYQSRLIFGFGRTEDIPVGIRVGLTAGPLYDEFEEQFYGGFRIGAAHLFKSIGYLLGSLEFGTYLYSKNFDEMAVDASILYFTPLIRLGKWRFRTFFKIDYLAGFNLPSEYVLSFNEEAAIRGLPDVEIKGNERMIFGFEPVAFSPWNLVGFRMAFFGFADVGYLGPSKSTFKAKNWFSGFGLGVRVRNESLIFNTLQVRFAFYPKTRQDASHFAIEFSFTEPELPVKLAGYKPDIISFR